MNTIEIEKEDFTRFRNDLKPYFAKALIRCMKIRKLTENVNINTGNEDIDMIASVHLYTLIQSFNPHQQELKHLVKEIKNNKIILSKDFSITEFCFHGDFYAIEVNALEEIYGHSKTFFSGINAEDNYLEIMGIIKEMQLDKPIIREIIRNHLKKYLMDDIVEFYDRNTFYCDECGEYTETRDNWYYHLTPIGICPKNIAGESVAHKNKKFVCKECLNKKAQS